LSVSTIAMPYIGAGLDLRAFQPPDYVECQRPPPCGGAPARSVRQRSSYTDF
jgi:hypothetical protein